MRLTITLSGSSKTRPGAGDTPSDWQRQIVLTLTAERENREPGDRTAGARPSSVSFSTYLASFLSNATYREFL